MGSGRAEGRSLREMNAVRRRSRPGSIKVGLLYPSTYEASLASLAYQSMYYYLNSLPEFVAERFTYDRGPVGLDSGSRLSHMDALLASVHYELDYANLVEMLRVAGVEPLGERRRSKPPLIIGGPAAVANPMPISEIADLVVVGDMEPLLPRLVEALARSPESAAEELGGHEGFFRAGAGHVRLVRAEELSLDFHPIAQLQPMDAEPIWGRSLLVESSRGCSRLCRFCMEGNVYFPAIHRPLDQILRIVERGLPANDVERVTFYSLSFFDHPDADSILRAISELGAQASLPSIRMDTLNADRLRTMSDLGQRTLTVAPESGACRLRRALGKPWPEEELLSVASTAADVGIEVLKLYYMLGLPGENPDSAETIAREVLHVKRAAHLRISVSVTPFMPKPHTPLQWAGMEDEDVLTRKIHALTSALRAEGIKVDFYSPRLARIQTAIARGGPEITCPLEEKARGLTWGRAFSACGIDVDARVSRLDLDEEVPWSIVDLPRPMDALRRAADTYWMELEGSDGHCA
ncbi:MAG: radical SAM protein [Conexivisphaera sp.]|jgi:radical SAM superfamily enzyme YgiQ (UPF0313 family)